MAGLEVQRWVAFAADPAGGNPAGVVLDATGADDAAMLAVAADLGYSESAFVVPLSSIEAGGRHVGVRYFSPRAEVPFCGHATIATAVGLAARYGVGEWVFETQAGAVPVVTRVVDGRVTATLTSVAPRVVSLEPPDLEALLAALGWPESDLDPALPPRLAYAGAWHPVIAAASRERLADLQYDYPALDALTATHSWTTVQLVWRERADLFWSRNPFPPGGIVEDPATGAAAAALGGYLRELGLVDPPAQFVIRQGDDLGRPGVLQVDVPAGAERGIDVTGTAVVLPD